MKKHIHHIRWTDKEVISWAEEYINSGECIPKLEVRLGVPHATIYWNFLNRLPRLDPELADLVLMTITENKKRNGYTYGTYPKKAKEEKKMNPKKEEKETKVTESKTRGIPCDTCIHKTVCGAKESFKDTEIKTSHPYIRIIFECSQYVEERVPRKF